MTAAREKLQILAFKLVSLSLCLWLSGATCAISCGAMTLRAADAANVEVTEESGCHGKTQRAKSADQKNDSEFSLVSAANRRATLDCCAFLNIIAEKAGKFRQVEQQFALANSPIRFSSEAKFERQTVSFQNFYQPIPLDRGSTYLRNCVFLI